MAKKFSNSSSESQEFPKIQLNKKITEIIFLIDKLTNVVFDVDSDDDVEGILENRKSNIITPIKLTLPKDDNGNDIPLSPVDKLILSAALSEQDTGNFFTTYSRIFHAIGGGQRLSEAPKIKEVIAESLLKLRVTHLKVDLTALAELYKQYQNSIPKESKNKKNILEGVLLPTEILTTTINGKIVDGTIHFLGKSILLKVAEIKKQLARCEQNLLEAPVRTTEQTLCLKGYLLERILKIKGSHDEKRNKRVRKLSNFILFDTVYKKCGLDANNTSRTTEYRKTITQILDHFITRNFIKSYNFVKKNGKFYSIEIFF